MIRIYQKKVLRQKVRAITKATFGFGRQERVAYLCVLRAIENIYAFERKKLSEDAGLVQVGRPPHRHYRPIIAGAIFRAWRMATGKTASVSKRLPGARYNDFVLFAKKILSIIGIANVIDNLDEFRTLGNQLQRSSWTWQVK